MPLSRAALWRLALSPFQQSNGFWGGSKTSLFRLLVFQETHCLVWKSSEGRYQPFYSVARPDYAVRPPTIIFILREFSLDNTCSHGVFVQTAVAYPDKRYLLRTFAVSYKRASVRTANSKVLRKPWFAPVWNKSQLRCSRWCSWHLAVHQLYRPSQHGHKVDMWRVRSARYHVCLQNIFWSLFRSTYIYFVCYLLFSRTPTSARTGSLLLSSSFKGTYFRTTHCPPRSELIATPVNNALANPWLYMRLLFVAVFLYSSTLMEWWLRLLRCKKRRTDSRQVVTRRRNKNGIHKRTAEWIH